MIYIIIIILLFLIIVYILHKLIKSLFKFIFSLFTLLTILILIMGLLAYNDIKDIKENINKPVLFLLEDNNQKLVAGFIKIKENITYQTEDKINIYNLKTKNEILNQNFKIMIFNHDFIENAPFQSIKNQDLNLELQKPDILTLLKSENPTKILTTTTNVTNNNLIKNHINDNSQLKAAILHYSITALIENKNIEYIIQSYKEKNIKIYKETITFKILKLLPNSIILKTMEKQM